MPDHLDPFASFVDADTPVLPDNTDTPAADPPPTWLALSSKPISSSGGFCARFAAAFFGVGVDGDAVFGRGTIGVDIKKPENPLVDAGID